jgi:hypothetical protein
MTFMELLSNGSSRHDQELEGEPRSKIHLVLDLQETFESEEIPVMSSLSKQFL